MRVRLNQHGKILRRLRETRSLGVEMPKVQVDNNKTHPYGSERSGLIFFVKVRLKGGVTLTPLRVRRPKVNSGFLKQKFTSCLRRLRVRGEVYPSPRLRAVGVLQIRGH